MLPASRFTRPGETTPRGEGAPVDFGAVMGEVITSSPLVERDGIMLDAFVYEIQAGYGVVLLSAYILFWRWDVDQCYRIQLESNK